MNLETEIRAALDALGYKDYQFTTETISYHREAVFIDGELIGLYDTDKHTFVD